MVKNGGAFLGCFFLKKKIYFLTMFFSEIEKRKNIFFFFLKKTDFLKTIFVK